MSGTESLRDDGHMGAQQAAPRKVEVRMLVGLGELDAMPTVAGCIETGTWEIIGADESDAIFEAWKRDYNELDPTIQWREVIVQMDAEKLLRHFSGPVIDGQVAE